MGKAVIVICGRHGMGRGGAGGEIRNDGAELENIECGQADESWGGIRVIPQGLDIPLGPLLIEAEGFAPCPGGKRRLTKNREVEASRAIPKPRDDAA